MSRTPGVSVILVNWNRCHLLRAALDSLVRQQGVIFEIIVVDNGSTDGSLDLLRNEYQKLPGLQLQVISNAENRGFCAANNQGFAAARYELVALLNNDAEADPGWLAALSSAFEDSRVGMAASKILLHEDPARIDKVGHLIYLDGQNRGRGAGVVDAGQFDRVEEVAWPDGCAAMYRRSMIEAIGGFDEDFFAYADDAELGLRARLAGWSCLYVPTAVVRHRRGTTLGVVSERRLMLIERNRILLVLKLFPWWLIVLNPLFFAMRLVASAWAAAHGRGEFRRLPGAAGFRTALRAVVRGQWEAVRLAPRILAKRRHVRALQTLSGRELWRLLRRHRIGLRELTQESA